MTDKFNELLKKEGIKYFSGSEVFRMNPPEELWGNVIPTLKVLDKVREHYAKPIKINSSYRSPEYNKSINGAKDSMHMRFSAIDFSIPESLPEVYRWIDSLPESDTLGLGLYDTFIHIDTRGLLGKPKSRWDLRKHK